jgi:Tol biopolymer transport system component
VSDGDAVIVGAGPAGLAVAGPPHQNAAVMCGEPAPHPPIGPEASRRWQGWTARASGVASSPMRAAGYSGSYAARCLIGLGVALLAILILPGSVLATAPGANGKIYYQGPQTGETGPTDIYRVNPDGSEPQDLTSGNGFSEERPNVSADGQHVVFQSFRDEGWNIFSMNADGSNQVDLTKTKQADNIINFEPTWSPDGTKVAFMRQTPTAGEEQDIWVMDANGTNPVNLTHTAGVSETSPEFSPDGTKIVYVSGATNNDIWVMNANGTGQTPLTETAPPVQNVAPTWSPDGSKIAYSVLEGPSLERGLHVMNANGSSQTQLLNESSPIRTDLLSWSPDGTQIAYKSVAVGGELRLVDALGGATSLLVENSGADYPSWAAVPAPPSPPPAGSTPSPATAISSKSGNHFSFGKLKLNKKKGTATLIVTVPGAGSLVLGGKGVKRASAQAKGPGDVTLPVKAAAKAKKKLDELGKLKLALKVTFTPGGGVVNTETTTVTLKQLPAA